MKIYANKQRRVSYARPILPVEAAPTSYMGDPPAAPGSGVHSGVVRALTSAATPRVGAEGSSKGGTLPAAGVHTGRELAGQVVQRSAGNHREGLADRSREEDVLQMRRIPAIGNGKDGGVLDLLSDPVVTSLGYATGHRRNAANFEAHATGLDLLFERTMAALSPTIQESVRRRIRKAVGADKLDMDLKDALADMEPRERLIVSSIVLAQQAPTLILGDPALMEVGPRPGTDDAKNLVQLVRGAEGVFETIASGAQDDRLVQVFGRDHLPEVKRRYAMARDWMNRLHKAGAVRTDRSGFMEETGIGGQSGFQQFIFLAKDVIDHPDRPESVVVLMHECMHAGNADIHDTVYIQSPGFLQLSAQQKLTNAAHFEVVPRGILHLAGAFEGLTFVPKSGSGEKGHAPQTGSAAVAGAAYQTLKKACTQALRLHGFLVRLYRHPDQWTKDQGAGRTFAAALPYWSKVMKLTIHLKARIEPDSADPSLRPVSLIDVALAEGFVHLLALALGEATSPKPVREAEDKPPHDTAERNTGLQDTADDLVRLHLQKVRVITGSRERDFRAVKALAGMDDGFPPVHDLSHFAD